MAKKKFPKEILVTIMDADDEDFMMVHDDIDNIPDGEAVAKYTLVETSKKSTTHALTKTKKEKK